MSVQIDGEALLTRVTKAIVGRDRQLIARLVTHDVHYEDAFADAPLLGPDQLGDHLAQLWEAFPDARVEATGPCLHDGDRIVALPLRLVGNNLGPIGSLPATERFLALHGVLVCELDATAHRLWRVRLFSDRFDAAVQLGILPATGTVADRAVRAIQGFGLLWRR